MQRSLLSRFVALMGLPLLLLAAGCGGPEDDLAIHHANIMDANPLEDIAHTREIDWVVQHGETYSSSQLDTLLESTRNE